MIDNTCLMIGTVKEQTKDNYCRFGPFLPLYGIECYIGSVFYVELRLIELIIYLLKSKIWNSFLKLEEL